MPHIDGIDDDGFGYGVKGEGPTGGTPITVNGKHLVKPDLGVWGDAPLGIGVLGQSQQNDGVQGRSAGVNASGVSGHHDTGGGYGVSGSTLSSYQPGSSGTAGVWGDNSGTGIGVKGTSRGGDAILGVSTSNNHAGVSAINDRGGYGVWARGNVAGHFEGNVEILAGDLNCS
jgi:hypothetical protein